MAAAWRGRSVLRRDPKALQDRGLARAVWPQTILIVKGPLVTFDGKTDRAGKGQDFIIAYHPAFTGVWWKSGALVGLALRLEPAPACFW